MLGLDPMPTTKKFSDERGVTIKEGGGGEQSRMVVVGKRQDIEGQVKSTIAKG